MKHLNIDSYYTEFMGVEVERINQGKVIFESKYRDLPLNDKYYYPIIQTDYFGQTILSVSPAHFKEIESLYKRKDESLELAIEEFLKNHPNHKIRRMHRYAYQSTTRVETTSQRMTLKDVDKLDFGGDFNFDEYRRRKEMIFREGRQFFVEVGNKVASIGFVSEIRCGGGNIVVTTLKDYQGKGYAKEVVKGCINWCIENNVMPIYLVENSNFISKKIPQRLSFSKVVEEIIISQF